ncbi:MAG: energy-coupling factor transporter transmembrane protein EcfT [Lachnospiraceae bacterium]|nr:energy-coupling factor transporter transmembrane protein EcfT [Lachnospiraceae bacterium]
MTTTLSFIEKDSLIHKMTGTTKLLFFLLWSIAAMVTYDTRVLLFLFVTGCVLFKVSKIGWSDIKVAVWFMAVLIAINMIGIYVFAPEQGVEIYGTRTVLVHIAGRYSITVEQLFYMFNFMMKYFAVIPVALLFILATNPSEFASSLSKIGVSYKVGYAVSIALRYIPDIQRDYHEISQAQQARGIDMSKKDSLMTRLKNSAAILFPLVLSSIERIETISNAMELRGFGKKSKRTWIIEKPFMKRDVFGILTAFLILAISITMLVVDGGRYWNPFI